MNYYSLKHNYLLLSTVILVFYPAKGLLNLSYYFIQFESYPWFFNKFLFFLAITSFLILFLNNKFEIKKYGVHILITFITLILSTLNGDVVLISNATKLFLLPILLSIFDNLPENYVHRVIRSFFKFTLIYMLIEYLLLNIRIDGVYLISQHMYQTFYDIIAPSGVAIDDRSLGSSLIVRSGGYMADPLAMPVLVLMSAIYFYINYRFYKKYFFYTIVGVFLVFSCVSTTAIISLVFTIFVFEFYHFSIKQVSILASIFIILTLVHPSFNYVTTRMYNNFNNPEYMSTFFDYDFMLDPQTYLNFIFGNWVWWSHENISSHLDIFLLINSMGLIGFYIIYRIFLRGLFVNRKGTNLITIYSYILLSTFVTLYHHAMATNLNVLLLAIFISNRVNNTIKPKINLDYIYYLSYLSTRIFSVLSKFSRVKNAPSTYKNIGNVTPKRLQ